MMEMPAPQQHPQETQNNFSHYRLKQWVKASCGPKKLENSLVAVMQKSKLLLHDNISSVLSWPLYASHEKLLPFLFFPASSTPTRYC